MTDLALYLVALPLVLWFAQRAWSAALAVARRNAKEAAALALARRGGPFSVAYATVRGLNGAIPSNPPWTREEYGCGR